ncbi:MAG: DUF4428 domain-containing protein [Oscillospiraceae bacterium]|nr:DUF4428 domain-containing protein [Oscillospiraceae bacterium]MBQ2997837.1 DUF4428 domain-containing protein [Oscillospiraceae bacterium]MBQ6700130.1 DUF4428 domain-containing protein [Oscillospiraceae bacterium]
MGLFGKLFEKENCAFCGKELGMFGKKKLEDGVMCGECQKKLSPWFSDRRSSTIAEIREQLDYREANKAEVAKFRTTRTFGENMKILLDEDARKFMVTDERNLIAANPDVLDFSDVTGCIIDVDEDRREIMRDTENGEVSYVPARYEYSYDFDVVINVRSPYFDEIRFRLNRSSVDIEVRGNMPPRPENNIQYREYKEMGEEIKKALTEVREQVREEAVAAAAPKTAMTCPWCGATTIPDENGCCEYCGGAMNA